jgi:hypothetical protein
MCVFVCSGHPFFAHAPTMTQVAYDVLLSRHRLAIMVSMAAHARTKTSHTPFDNLHRKSPIVLGMLPSPGQ